MEAKGKKPLWRGRNVGKLTQMLNVPMDVFFEVSDVPLIQCAQPCLTRRKPTDSLAS